MTEKLKYVQKSVSDLTANPRNARTHSAAQIKKLAKSIKEFGFISPAVIDSQGVLVAGHGRLLAAKQIGLATIPCLIVDHLTEVQLRAYMLMDNRSALDAGWDDDILKVELNDLASLNYDLDFTGFDLDEVQAHVRHHGEIEGEDDVPEAPETPVSKLGDIWLLGDHRLMCGDSTSKEQIETLMDGQKADMVFTDPPYGVSYAAKNEYLNAISRGNHIQKEIKNDHMNLEDTSNFVFQAFCRIKEILAERSSYYITAPQGGDLMMMMMMMQKAGLPLRHCLIWAKNNHVLGRTDYNYKHEPILFGWDKVHDFYGEGDHKFSVWEIPKPLKNDLHPTMKPVALVENAILNSTRKGNLVADIFGGSGTTLIACEKTNRQCLMMELSESYVDVIVKRWQDFTGRVATHEATGETFNQKQLEAI